MMRNISNKMRACLRMATTVVLTPWKLLCSTWIIDNTVLVMIFTHPNPIQAAPAPAPTPCSIHPKRDNNIIYSYAKIMTIIFMCSIIILKQAHYTMPRHKWCSSSRPCARSGFFGYAFELLQFDVAACWGAGMAIAWMCTWFWQRR